MLRNVLLSFAIFAPWAAAAAPAALSPFFSTTCVVCHGANGDEGFAPPLSGLDYTSYYHAVRRGHPEKGVPAFAADEYPDAVLKADFFVLTKPPRP